LKLRTFENFAAVNVGLITEEEDEDSGEITVSFTATCTYGTNPAFLDETEETTEEAE
jgi:hypothetical protein